MTETPKLEAWVRSEINRARIVSALAALVYLPLIPIFIFLTWCLVGTFVLFVGPWIGLGHLILPATHTLTLALLVLLWYQNRTLQRSGEPEVEMINNDFSEGDGSSLAPQVMNQILGLAAVMAASMTGIGGLFIAGRGGVSPTTGPKVITFFLFLVPKTIDRFYQAIRKCWLLSGVDVADTASVLQILLNHEHKVPFTELADYKDQFFDQAGALTNLAFFEGVMYLVAPPAGMALTSDLRRELLNL
ncbi:MAG TPA: hypothetical protein VL860_01525 [Planctomycetota bacterium]|nr:hypothetical protein [Planctomycetota bacterium]